MRVKRNLWIAGALLFSLTTTVFAIGGRLDKIVAIVDDQPITQAELTKETQLIRTRFKDAQAQMPSEDILQKQVLEKILNRRIVLQRAEREGIRIDDTALNEAVANIAKQNGYSLAQFRQMIEQDGSKFSDFREQAREEMILSRVQQREIGQKIRVTDEEVDRYLVHLEHDASSTAEYHLAHILLSLPEEPTTHEIQEAEKKAQAVVQKLKDGASFKEVAMEFSQDDLALNGGDLGWRKGGEIPSIFAAKVPALAVNEISEPLRSPSGFHIIKLVEKRSKEQEHTVTETHARHILVKTDAVTTDRDAKSRLEELARQLHHGADFTTLARAHSDDHGSAAKGGDLGWVATGAFTPAFEETMDRLLPHQISTPVQTQFGWHIIEVLERRTFDDTKTFQRNQARQQIYRRKFEEEALAWQRQLREEAFVKVLL